MLYFLEISPRSFQGAILCGDNLRAARFRGQLEPDQCRLYTLQNTTEKYKQRLALLYTNKNNLLLTSACLYFEFFVVLGITRVSEQVRIRITNLIDPLTTRRHFEGGDNPRFGNISRKYGISPIHAVVPL